MFFKHILVTFFVFSRQFHSFSLDLYRVMPRLVENHFEPQMVPKQLTH